MVINPGVVQSRLFARFHVADLASTFIEELGFILLDFTEEDKLAYLDQFNYQITGLTSGPKLVFLHGLLGSHANWRKITSILSDSYHILAFDQRGHGRSFHARDGYSPEKFAEDLHLILEELQWNAVAVVGHSMGGRNALAFAHLWPQSVTKLVIEDIGPSPDPNPRPRVRQWIEAVPVPFATRDDAKTYFHGPFTEMVNGDGQGKALADFFYSNMTEVDGVITWRVDVKGVIESLLAGRMTSQWQEWEGLKVPTLLIRGEHSRDLPRATYLEMLQRNPRVRGVEIEGAGHWVHFDQPHRFVEELRAFLSL